VFGGERKQRQVTGALYRQCQTALVLCAGSRLATRADFAAICQVTAEQVNILIRHSLYFVHAKIAKLVAAWTHSTATRTTSAPAPATIIKIVHLAIIIAHRFNSL
jgi:hypothetical protein